jgi:hypothetical protein
MPLVLVLAFLPPGEKLAGIIEQLPLPRAVLDCLAATDRLHGDPGLELGPVSAALAQFLRRRLCLRREPRIKGCTPPHSVTIGAAQES